jgi:hypothetical protein
LSRRVHGPFDTVACVIPKNESFAFAWQGAQPRPPVDGSRESKKNFAERFSRCLAEQLTVDLRTHLGDEVRTAAEVTRSVGERGASGLDIVYGNPVKGLGLGISLKTVTFADAKTARFTKNYTRIDHELRSEAIDHHERQPYAVLVALLFLPVESAIDGAETQVAPSSFGRAVERFRPRIGRIHPHGEFGRFERMYIGLYDVSKAAPAIGFFDARLAPPKRGIPELVTWEEMVEALVAAHHERNYGSAFQWLDDLESGGAA